MVVPYLLVHCVIGSRGSRAEFGKVDSSTGQSKRSTCGGTGAFLHVNQSLAQIKPLPRCQKGRLSYALTPPSFSRLPFVVISWQMDERRAERCATNGIWQLKVASPLTVYRQARCTCSV
jgi:hypothetical protein